MALKPGSIIRVEEILSSDDYIRAPNGQYFAVMQSDGNFCIYRGTGPGDNKGGVWCSNRQSLPGGAYFAIVQGDGNFCVYRGTGLGDNRGGVWCSNQHSLPGGAYFASLGDDGRLFVYKGTGPGAHEGAVWCSDASVPLGLFGAASDEAKRFAPSFDFDTDSCYAAPATWLDGTMNKGLNNSGSITGGCRSLEQLQIANTYARTTAIARGGSTYRVYMYALYFQKDQAVAGADAIGHRHDWEYALMWIKDGVLTHASYSAHGDVTTRPRGAIEGDGDHVKIVYHKGGGGTHCFRFAKQNEQPENGLRRWFTPVVVEWESMRGVAVSNAQLRTQFNTFNYGKANCSFNDNHFPNEIAKSPPAGYPSGDEWRQAARQAMS
jgi:hypothetical protein